MFRDILLGIGTLLFAFAPPLGAQETISDEDQTAIDGALSRGLNLYLYDQAAWHGTDALREDVTDLSKTGIRGWVINEVDAGHEVVFYRPTQKGFEAVWSGVYAGRPGEVLDRTIYQPGERVFTEMEASKALANSLVREQEFKRCSAKPFNSVVMATGKGDGSLYVYYLVPQESVDTVPLGGHYRFEVKGGKVIGQRTFTNSCISMPLKGKDGGDEPEALMISHLLDPVPTEIHVFSTFAAGVPIYVMTTQNDLVWVNELVEGQPRLRLIKEGL
ncbi:MAG: hypothetical protein AAF127_10555 [Pseudomonadota bacterium]